MSNEYLDIEIVTMSKVLLQARAEYVTVPATLGEIGVYPGHCSFVSTLSFGVLTCDIGKETKRFAIHRGYFEVSDNKLTVLADLAENSEDVDTERAKIAGEKAQTKLDEIIKSQISDENRYHKDLQKYDAKLRRSIARQSA